METQLKGNPFALKDKQNMALDEAYQLVLTVFIDYAEKHNLSDEEISSIKTLIKSAYLERKAFFYFGNKLHEFSTFIDDSFNFILNKDKLNGSKGLFSKFFYYSLTQKSWQKK